ncbi:MULTISPECIES: LLM class flavin-dependent oxidoreductase [Nonomuraea]|uniref:LLM class flavin-dependent oxidoreductase n=1 Tax=Nonomuraea mangrovi TaxID=2316207 RepID=A0ABW4SZ99_9ACTN
MHELWFGAFLTPTAENAHTLMRQAALAEDVGLDIIGVQDHPYQPSFLDTWTLLSVLAARTQHIRFFPDVASVPLRPPAVLARAAASLDILSGGRVELGVGSGAFWDGVAAMGGPRRTPAQAVAALAEGIEVMRALWTPGGPVAFDGEHYRLDGAAPGPFPPHRIGVWVGAYKRRMLELTGRTADGWVPSSAYAAPEELAAMSAVVDRAAADAGRDPALIRRVYNVSGRFSRLAGPGFLDGPPSLWADQLAELVHLYGMSVFVMAPTEERDLKIFAEEVAPEVRAALGREQRQAAEPGTSPSATLDESSRPRLPKRDLAELSPAQRERGMHLVRVHDGLREELAEIRKGLEQVAAGRGEVAALRSLINRLTMRQNYWTLGSFCASYCRVVTTHHTIEDERMFPALRAAQASLAPVIDRLEEEHEVIAGLLTGLDAALVAMVEDPDGIDGVRDALDALAGALLSHLEYEEQELVEPLARLDLDV